ncbi:auxin response factor 13-like [Triticum dicoccoides]|uniref:auxin response factor 13-like n=1 Tax=Triticum dicoccoides TaxID=85692 RepID=UPI00188E6C70|nr:auxin response factor 13-like [Triticum dicoccoides]
MADAPPPATPAPLDRDVWLACATPLSRVPAVGSQVYYFPHGHSEQCPAPPRAPAHNLFPCTVAAVRLFADPKTDEPFATVDLVPGPHRDPALHLPDADAHADAATGFRYYAKQLTQSDANNGGGFSVPRFCAELVFPPLDFEADPPVQRLRMTDPLGRGWDFRHIYRGTPRRHLLTTGWSKFVNAKLLVAGDAVVFMRRADGELLAGIRRAPRYPAVSQQGAERRPRNARARVPPEEVDEAVRLAAEGAPFTVTYYPRQGAGEFVVPKQEVEDALVGAWAPGVQVRMKFLDAEERRSEWVNGIVKAVDPSIWRMLEIDWDESVVGSLRNRHVNAWQVELVGYPPILKKLKISETTLPPMCSGDVGMADPLLGPDCENMVMLLGSPMPAGMQGARHIGLSELPSSSPTVLTTKLFFPPSSSGGSSEVVNPEAGSPPNNSVNMRPSEERRSIQLFGATITSPVQSATNGSSEEVSQAPDAAVDGTAHEYASATSLLDCQLTIGKDDGHDRNASKQEA